MSASARAVAITPAQSAKVTSDYALNSTPGVTTQNTLPEFGDGVLRAGTSFGYCLTDASFAVPDSGTRDNSGYERFFTSFPVGEPEFSPGDHSLALRIDYVDGVFEIKFAE